jgi:hypothetical protein
VVRHPQACINVKLCLEHQHGSRDERSSRKLKRRGGNLGGRDQRWNLQDPRLVLRKRLRGRGWLRGGQWRWLRGGQWRWLRGGQRRWLRGRQGRWLRGGQGRWLRGGQWCWLRRRQWCWLRRRQWCWLRGRQGRWLRGGQRRWLRGRQGRWLRRRQWCWLRGRQWRWLRGRQGRWLRRRQWCWLRGGQGRCLRGRQWRWLRRRDRYRLRRRCRLRSRRRQHDRRWQHDKRRALQEHVDEWSSWSVRSGFKSAMTYLGRPAGQVARNGSRLQLILAAFPEREGEIDRESAPRGMIGYTKPGRGIARNRCFFFRGVTSRTCRPDRCSRSRLRQAGHPERIPWRIEQREARGRETSFLIVA